ncbi:uncharacterized protein BKCO1_27000124 [Diplodia corticola]|uniref:Uncharacterized protein n=1 Tax=Diplodia corticola TaxID=236234 RepID=A0A1J9QXU5_9PEZI|nr:uncharacterized protein BKCO1_27000124 [Diplodia corticola]OJD33854.1 hypothetical protein BKCO1_27000124 [Diplodia corticola]
MPDTAVSDIELQVSSAAIAITKALNLPPPRQGIAPSAMNPQRISELQSRLDELRLEIAQKEQQIKEKESRLGFSTETERAIREKKDEIFQAFVRRWGLPQWIMNAERLQLADMLLSEFDEGNIEMIHHAIMLEKGKEVQTQMNSVGANDKIDRMPVEANRLSVPVQQPPSREVFNRLQQDLAAERARNAVLQEQLATATSTLEALGL